MFRDGCPARIQTDGGRPYVSKAINEFFSDYKITHTVAAPYHPESNGMAERFIQTLKGKNPVLKKMECWIGKEQ